LALTAFALLSSAIQAIEPPDAAAATGPSVPLPGISSVPVTEEQVSSLPAGTDQDASRRELRGDQAERGTQEGSGSYRATPLAPSATWNVAPQTGDFTWTYPLRVPPAPGGLEPDLALSYRSSAVDGRTSATNNQPSWIGDGWDLSPGFVERTYVGCADDTEGGTTPPKTGDLCWRSANATASYGGGGGALIRDDTTGMYRAKSDDGSRIELLTGAGNGAHNGEHWKITTVDGTQYWFGSQPSASSTWTVPVFGDDAGEPCHAATFDDSHCKQTWRWNLDRVVDRNGNVIRYAYDAESNSYGLNLKDAAVEYTRGGTLRTIEYGLNENVESPSSGRVTFTTADRCVPGSTCTLARKENWPDTALDELCDTAQCADRHAPTFWSTRRLDSITTEVRKGDDFAPVDRWTLDQQFPDPGDGEKAALWLKSITHTGLVGGSAILPSIRFEGTRLPNRIRPDSGDGMATLNRFRVTSILSEAGGLTSVTYEPECRHGALMPAHPETNTLRCFPVQWAKKNYAERTDYFHKYAVTQVVQSDRLSSSKQETTRFEYLGGAAWHWDTSEFVKEDKKTWNEFRGYGRVRVRKGAPDDPAGPVTMSEQRFYRGMDGDRLPAGTRSVQVEDSEGGKRTDADWLQGFAFESATFESEAPSSAPDPQRVSKTITDPHWSGPTATRGGQRAYIVRPGTVRGYTALAPGGHRTTRSTTAYDDLGLPTAVTDHGDITDDTDDRCTRTTYAPKTDPWLINLPSRVETVAVACDTEATFPADAISDTRNSYDERGNLVHIEVAKNRPATGPEYVTTAESTVDVHGRTISSTDALGHTARTAFVPRTGGPVTGTVTTTPGTTTIPAGMSTTTTVEPAWGPPIQIVDANNRKTELRYDALGRTAEVWLPNRARTAHAEGSLQFAYDVRYDAMNVVTTTKIGPNGRPVLTRALYDGWLRPRQEQVPAVGGGRLLADIRYDSHGRSWKSTQRYFNDAPIDDKLWISSDVEVPGHTRTEYDGAGRATATVFYAGANERWRSTTTFGGDRIHVTLPAGGTATTTISDAHGRPVEVRQYAAPTPTGDFDATRYEYSKAGHLRTVKDPGGNTWTFTYDLRGRRTVVDDPDRGTSVTRYDAQAVSHNAGVAVQ
jgi:YD repeat-containing protein